MRSPSCQRAVSAAVQSFRTPQFEALLSRLHARGRWFRPTPGESHVKRTARRDSSQAHGVERRRSRLSNTRLLSSPGGTLERGDASLATGRTIRLTSHRLFNGQRGQTQRLQNFPRYSFSLLMILCRLQRPVDHLHPYLAQVMLITLYCLAQPQSDQ